MTESTASTTTVRFDEAEGDTSTECMACGHPVSTHDLIAVRYCNATIDNALTRGCLCREA